MDKIETMVNDIQNIILSDLSKPEKAAKAIQKFSGLELTYFKKPILNHLYKRLGNIRSILSRYPGIKSYDDYALITGRHLEDILENIQELCLVLKLTSASPGGK